jgi:hypothetical protein
MTAQRRRLVALAAGVAVVLVAVVLLARSCGGDEPPPQTAIRLVPETALVYAHFSTDAGRDANERAGELLGRFSTFERQRDSILQRLSGSPNPVSFERDVEPWLGDQGVFALLESGTATAGSLVIVEVDDEEKAQAFLGRNPRQPGFREYKGERIAQYGTVNVAFKNGFMVIGQGPSVQAALDRGNERGDSLDETPTYRRASRDLPAGRVLHAYATADGLRRLLIPQGDVVGALASLLDQPSLQAVSLSMQAVDDGARVTTRSALDPRAKADPLTAFEPALLGDVPEDTLAYFGVTGISDVLGRVIGAAAGGGGDVTGLLQQLRRQLDREAGGRLERDLLRLFDQEVAVVLSRATPAPILALMTRAPDEARTRETLQRLQAPLAKLLTPRGEEAPRWRAEDFGGGARGATLATPVGASLSYAVVDGRLVMATSPDGVRRLRDPKGEISGADGFEEVLGDRPEKVGSLGFLDFSQLLELGEQTGLNDSRAYLAARDDLQKIRAVGVNSTGTEEETTAEILLSIP